MPHVQSYYINTLLLLYSRFLTSFLCLHPSLTSPACLSATYLPSFAKSWWLCCTQIGSWAQSDGDVAILNSLFWAMAIWPSYNWIHMETEIGMTVWCSLVCMMCAQLTNWLEGEFLEEQVKASKQLSEYITRLTRAGSGLGEHLIDHELSCSVDSKWFCASQPIQLHTRPLWSLTLHDSRSNCNLKLKIKLNCKLYTNSRFDPDHWPWITGLFKSWKQYIYQDSCALWRC